LLPHQPCGSVPPLSGFDFIRSLQNPFPDIQRTFSFLSFDTPLVTLFPLFVLKCHLLSLLPVVSFDLFSTPRSCSFFFSSHYWWTSPLRFPPPPLYTVPTPSLPCIQCFFVPFRLSGGTAPPSPPFNRKIFAFGFIQLSVDAPFPVLCHSRFLVPFERRTPSGVSRGDFVHAFLSFCYKPPK